MEFVETAVSGVYLVEQKRHEDERGFFTRTWCAEEFHAKGLADGLRQCSMSYNRHRGTLRGLHYQTGASAEDKLIHCIGGALFDVALDLRPGSATYGQSASVELTKDNGRMIYIPRGVAHGFLTLANDTCVTYFISEDYNEAAQDGLRHDDPAFAISWPIPITVISERDRNWPDFLRRMAKKVEES